MTRFLLFSVLFLLMLPMRLLHAQESGSSVTQEDFFSERLNRTYQYRVYLPSGYDVAVTYPVVYLLHGRGDTMDAWLNIRDALDEMIENADIPAVIAIMPDMPSSDRASYYIDSQYTGRLFRAEAVETAFFEDLIPHIERTYAVRTDREGRIIGGYSMGGYGAIRYSMAHPDVFAGALVLSPAVYTPLPPADSSTREFGAFGIGSTLFDESTYRGLNYPAITNAFIETGHALSMFIAVGDDEWKHPNPEDQLHDLDIEAHLLFNHLVRIASVQSEFRVYDGGHDWTVWRRGFTEGMIFLTRNMATNSGG